MVVAGREGLEVVESVNSDGVFRGIVANGSRVAGDVAFSDVVRGLSTNQETIASEDSISGESGALEKSDSVNNATKRSKNRISAL